MSAERVIIRGKVQGVWFRAWTVDTATRFGLQGWVRNKYDGSVEALFAGPADKIEAMVEACRRGPKHASVSGVERFSAEPPKAPGFRQLPDAD